MWSDLVKYRLLLQRSTATVQARSQGGRSGRSERSDDPPPALKGHFSADCSSANILNIVRL